MPARIDDWVIADSLISPSNTLLRSSAQQEPRPQDAAFLAMAHYQLGHEKAAREMLALLHGMMQEERWAGLIELQSFLRKADELIGAGEVEAVTAVYAVAPELREAFDLDPFYEKYVDAGGIPILASREVSDDALIGARRIVRHMMSNSPELYEPLRHNKIRIAIIASDQSTTDIPEHRDREAGLLCG